MARAWAHSAGGGSTGVGLVTGFFGVGGGFVVVPALAARAGHASLALDWPLIGAFAVAAVIGAVAGGSLAGRANPQWLSAAFTVLIVLVACYTLSRSLPGLL